MDVETHGYLRKIDRIGSYRTYPTLLPFPGSEPSISPLQWARLSRFQSSSSKSQAFRFTFTVRQRLQALHSQVTCLAYPRLPCPTLCAVLPFFLPALPYPAYTTPCPALPCPALPALPYLRWSYSTRLATALLPCLPTLLTCAILPDP